MLLQASKYKRFNVKQRLAKMSLVKKFIFAIQTDWYQLESIPWVVDTLRLIAQADFSTDNTIKPIVAYLAANLHTGTNLSSTLKRQTRTADNFRRESAVWFTSFNRFKD